MSGYAKRTCGQCHWFAASQRTGLGRCHASALVRDTETERLLAPSAYDDDRACPRFHRACGPVLGWGRGGGIWRASVVGPKHVTLAALDVDVNDDKSFSWSVTLMAPECRIGDMGHATSLRLAMLCAEEAARDLGVDVDGAAKVTP